MSCLNLNLCIELRSLLAITQEPSSAVAGTAENTISCASGDAGLRQAFSRGRGRRNDCCPKDPKSPPKKNGAPGDPGLPGLGPGAPGDPGPGRRGPGDGAWSLGRGPKCRGLGQSMAKWPGARARGSQGLGPGAYGRVPGSGAPDPKYRYPLGDWGSGPRGGERAGGPGHGGSGNQAPAAWARTLGHPSGGRGPGSPRPGPTLSVAIWLQSLTSGRTVSPRLAELWALEGSARGGCGTPRMPRARSQATVSHRKPQEATRKRAPLCI